jgi:hypothetical protein
MRKWSYLIPVVLLGSLLAMYAVAHVVAQAAATTPSLETSSTAPQEWTAFAIPWADDNQKGFLTLNELAGTTEAWSFGGPMGLLGANPLSGSSTSADVSPTPLPASALLFGSGLVGLGLLGWRRERR